MIQRLWVRIPPSVGLFFSLSLFRSVPNQVLRDLRCESNNQRVLPSFVAKVLLKGASLLKMLKLKPISDGLIFFQFLEIFQCLLIGGGDSTYFIPAMKDNIFQSCHLSRLVSFPISAWNLKF